MASDEKVGEDPRPPERPEHCKGCMKIDGCDTRRDPAVLSKLQPKYSEHRIMYFPCNTIFGDEAARVPESNRVVRVRVGEAGIQY